MTAGRSQTFEEAPATSATPTSTASPNAGTDAARAADPLAHLDPSALRDRVRDTDRELDTFLHAVSHDLREPLRSLEGFSMALLEDYEDALEGDGAVYLGRLRGAVHRLGDRLDALLELARLNRQPLHLAPVDLSALFEAELLRLAAAEPARVVHVTVAPGLRVNADPPLMRTVVSHLINNAWKFSRERTPAYIVIDRDPASNAVRITDNGAGFDMRYAERILAPFGRFHAEREFEGLGMGLSIAQRIILRHGGSLSLLGAVDGGATVCFDV